MNLDENAAEQPVTEPESVEPDALAEITAERDALREQMLRSMAEAQNVQRRLREQHREDLKFASQPLVTALLPVLDNLERSLAALEGGASVDKVLEGVRAIERQLRQALSAAKVERIDAVGKVFDPEIHEALGTVATDEVPEDTVVAQVEPGYAIHGRVVRPARVQVAKKP
jgi:molecular chaperone GrpE